MAKRLNGGSSPKREQKYKAHFIITEANKKKHIKDFESRRRFAKR